MHKRNQKGVFSDILYQHFSLKKGVFNFLLHFRGTAQHKMIEAFIQNTI